MIKPDLPDYFAVVVKDLERFGRIMYIIPLKLLSRLQVIFGVMPAESIDLV